MNLFEVTAHLFHPRHSNNHRPRLLHPEGFLLLFLLVIGFELAVKGVPRITPENGSILGYSSSITPDKVVDLTNTERAKLGIPSLVVNEKLTNAAKAKALDMFSDQYWAHYSPQGKTPWDFMKTVEYRYTVAGENLARDFLESEAMIQAWMSSPSHRQNIVNPRYEEIGIAVVDGVLKGTETTLVVQMFGSTSSTQADSGNISQTAPRTTAAPQPTSTPATLNSQALSVTEEVPEEAYDPRGLLAQGIPSPETFQQSLTYLQDMEYPPLFTPLHVTKAVFLAMILLVLSVLIYDAVIIDQLNTVRFVGKNFAHIALFLTILFLIIFFKGGVVGA